MADAISAAAARILRDLPQQGIGRGTTQGITQGGDTGVRSVPLGELTGGPTFAENLTQAINGVSARQDNAALTLKAFLRGDDVAVHQVMAATEEAQISLEMLIEVRNKFLDAYRTLTTMQG
jgi:flagellar hook-basal body complex protein FliE